MENNKEILNAIVEYLNDYYSQDSENYDIVSGVTEKDIIRFNENTAISFWSCGAIVCINHILYFISEDDGNWRMNCENSPHYGYGLLDCFSIGWADDFTNAIIRLKTYVEENGHPVYYSGIKEKTIAHYSL